MEEEFAPLNIQVAFVKTDPELIKKLLARLSAKDCDGCINPYKDEHQVKMLMRYNVWTIAQFCDVSGLAVSSVTNLARPTFSQGKLSVKLNVCYPFPDSDGNGPKFVVRNKKSENYIKV